PELAAIIVIGRADIEFERTERRARAGGHRHLDGRAGRKPHAVEVRIDVEPPLLGVDIGPDRRLARRIADLATGKTAAAASRERRISGPILAWRFPAIAAGKHPGSRRKPAERGACLAAPDEPSSAIERARRPRQWQRWAIAVANS